MASNEFLSPNKNLWDCGECIMFFCECQKFLSGQGFWYMQFFEWYAILLQQFFCKDTPFTIVLGDDCHRLQHLIFHIIYRRFTNKKTPHVPKCMRGFFGGSASVVYMSNQNANCTPTTNPSFLTSCSSSLKYDAVSLVLVASSRTRFTPASHRCCSPSLEPSN